MREIKFIVDKHTTLLIGAKVMKNKRKINRKPLTNELSQK